MKKNNEESKKISNSGIAGQVFVCPECHAENTILRVEIDCTLHGIYDIETRSTMNTEEDPNVYNERFFCLGCEYELTQEDIINL
jgi:hypothetical protein